MTGSFLSAHHPMNSHVENIIIDYARFRYFYQSYLMYWNYPEANILPTLFFRNITVENSNYEYTGNQLDVIRSADPGNITAENLNATKWFFQGQYIASSITLQLVPICIPTDGIQQFIRTTNLSHSLLGNERK